MTTPKQFQPLKKLAEDCLQQQSSNPTILDENLAKLLLELLKENDDLWANIKETEERIAWLEEHGPQCECRECRIPY